MAEQTYDTMSVLDLAGEVQNKLLTDFPTTRPIKLYAVPTGGIPARLAVFALDDDSVFVVEEDWTKADAIIDDLIDTGRTMERFPDKPFYALIDKRSWAHGDAWVVWPWEGNGSKGIEDHIVRLLQYVGENPDRGGLAETPARVAKAWKEWCSGYDKDPADILKTFEDGAETLESNKIGDDHHYEVTTSDPVHVLWSSPNCLSHGLPSPRMDPGGQSVVHSIEAGAHVGSARSH